MRIIFVTLFGALVTSNLNARAEELDDFIDRIFRGSTFEASSKQDVENIPRAKRADENPCSLPDHVPNPNFTPTRRKSDAVCFDYVWSIRHSEELNKRFLRCKKYKEDNPRSWGPVLTTLYMDEPSSDYPHMAAIGWKAVNGTWVFMCSGTLISSRFALTAAHCTTASSQHPLIADPDPKVVRLGDHNLLDVAPSLTRPEPPSQTMFIENVFVHPSYVPFGKYFDVALVEFRRDILQSKLARPACLWTKKHLPATGEVTAWDVTELASLKTTPKLPSMQVKVEEEGQCKILLQPLCNNLWCGMLPHDFCVRSQGPSSNLSQGASGGPLQSKIKIPVNSQGVLSYVIGVESFHYSNNGDYVGVFTRVADIIDWLEPIVWKPPVNRYTSDDPEKNRGNILKDIKIILGSKGFE